MKVFYKVIDQINKNIANNIVGGTTMTQTFGLITFVFLDWMAKTNRVWHTREVKVAKGVASSSSITNEQRLKDKESDENIGRMITQMNLLTKHVTRGGSKSVNAVENKWK